MDKIKYYYQILELKPGASADEIRRAYKDLVKVWHPDRFPNDHNLQQKANDKLKQINLAYQGLSDYLAAPLDEIFQQQKEQPSTATQRGYENTASEFSERIPCVDGNCIGTVNEYGYCNICGKRYKSEESKSNFKDQDVEEDFLKREPCPDRNCIGTINEYGHCNICGRASSNFGKNQEIPKVSAETYSIFPIYQMLQKDKPFNEWKATKTEIPRDLGDTFQWCVWMYQMYAFYILTVERFGYVIADRVLHIQVEKLNSVSEFLGQQLEVAIRQIHRNVLNQLDKTPFSFEVQGKKVEMPVEYYLAMEFLTIGEEAPFRIDRKEFEAGNLPDFKGADFALAECLAHGKDAAVTYFRPIVQVSKVVF